MINFSGSINLTYKNKFEEELIVTLTGNGNQIIGNSNGYNELNITNNEYNLGIITYDENEGFSGNINFVLPISIATGSYQQILPEVNKNVSVDNTYINQMANTPQDELSTVIYKNNVGLNNQTVEDIIRNYDIYYTGPADGGFIGIKNKLVMYGPNPLGFENGEILFDYDTLTFSGYAYLRLTYPWVTPFRNFIFEPTDSGLENAVVLDYSFKGQNNSIIAYNGAISGSITVNLI